MSSRSHYSQPTWQHQWKAILIITFLVGCGLWLLSFSWTHVQTAQRLDQSSTVVVGQVIGSSSRALSSKGGQSSMLVVRYTPIGHPAITKEFDVDSDDYKESCRRAMSA